MEKDHYIRFDWAAKRLLRNKANFGVLEGFLTVLLGEKITIQEILESESNQTTYDDKYNRVDIKARNSKDEIIIVEIQNTRELYYLERILYGVAKAITEHLSLGSSYEGVKKVYSISILYFDIGKGSDYLYHGQNKFTGVHTGDQLLVSTKEKNAIIQRKPAEIFPEYFLIRVNEFDKLAVTPLEEWIAYLKDGTIRSDTTVPGLQEAREKLQYYNMSKQEKYAYDEHINAIMIQNDVLGTAKLEGLQEGRAIGIEEGKAKGLAEGKAEGKAEGLAEGLAEGRAKGKAEGLAEGEKKKQTEIARNLKSMGIPVEAIRQATGLTPDEIDIL